MSPPRRLFGTDGIRAPFGREPLDHRTVTILGRELAATLGDGAEVVLGGDTRESTPVLCRWLVAGLRAGGTETRFLGIVPTPAVAFDAARSGAAAGIAVSASHNLPPDNGIKLLDHRGRKWSTAAEADLETRLDGEGVDGEGIDLEVDGAGVAAYLDHVEASVSRERSDRPLRGLDLVLDCANGATSPFAGDLFRRLGASVRVLAATPDGKNINRDCGSTHPENLATAVREYGADAGFAFDGDGDRVILVDEEGRVRDGDAILYAWARDLDEQGLLDPRAIVATTMSNLGLERGLGARGIRVVRCGVGDRQVVEAMDREGIALGGEQSGHVVCSRLSTTGDGLVTALQLAEIRHRYDEPWSRILAGFYRFPQLLRNVPVEERRAFEEIPVLQKEVARTEEELGTEGRLVLRYSGTEPVARIMLEGPDEATLERLADRLTRAIESTVGGTPR